MRGGAGRLSCAAGRLLIPGDLVEEPLAKCDELGRIGKPRWVHEVVLPGRGNLDIEQPHQEPVSQIVAEQRCPHERDALPLDRRLDRMRRVAERRPARGLGPIQAGRLEPRLPQIVVGAQQRVAGQILGTRRKTPAGKVRAADREVDVIEHEFHVQPGPRPESVANPDVDVVALEIRDRIARADIHVDVRVCGKEPAYSRQ